MTSGLWRQRVLVRVLGYGIAIVAVALSSVLGQLDRPWIPLAIAAGGLVFAVPVRRLQTAATVAAVAFDTTAAVVLGLVAGSWALGSLTVFVAAATISVGRTTRQVRGIALVAASAVTALVALEHTPGIPLLPTMGQPVGTIVAAVAAIGLTVAGLEVIAGLTSGHAAASEEAQEATRRWWAFIDAAASPIIVEQGGRVIRMNRSAEAITRLPAASVVGTPIAELLSPVDEADQLWTIETAHGSIEVELVRTPLVVASAPATLIVLKDVSPQVESRRRLERMVVDKDQFVATVSHELRTPLTAVVGLSSTLDEGWASLDETDRQEMVGLIAQQSREVAYIVDDLLVVARSGADSVTIHSEQVDLGREVSVAATAIDPEHKSLEITGDARAFADPRRVKQIVRNLLTNAVRHGGSEIVVEIENRDGRAFVRVSDSGPPIDSASRERIFEPFGRAHDGSKKTSVGLGLTVSRQLAAAMDGSLTYDHNGGWSRFVLELPRTG